MRAPRRHVRAFDPVPPYLTAKHHAAKLDAILSLRASVNQCWHSPKDALSIRTDISMNMNTQELPGLER